MKNNSFQETPVTIEEIRNVLTDLKTPLSVEKALITIFLRRLEEQEKAYSDKVDLIVDGYQFYQRWYTGKLKIQILASVNRGELEFNNNWDLQLATP